jgi:tetratricopeptide (TPR) repeat protein
MALARARFDRGHMAEAAQEAAAAVESYRRSLGEGHPAHGRALHTLGTVRAELGDPVGAATLLRRAAKVLRASLGADSGQVQAAEVELGWLALREGRPDEAEARADAARAAYARRPPPDLRPAGLATILRGLAAEARGEPEAAARLFREGQALIEAAQGPESPDLGFSLVRLGRLLTHTLRLAEAVAPLDRAIAIFARVGGAGSADPAP